MSVGTCVGSRTRGGGVTRRGGGASGREQPQRFLAEISLTARMQPIKGFGWPALGKAGLGCEPIVHTMNLIIVRDEWEGHVEELVVDTIDRVGCGCAASPPDGSSDERKEEYRR